MEKASIGFQLWTHNHFLKTTFSNSGILSRKDKTELYSPKLKKKKLYRSIFLKQLGENQNNYLFLF